MSDVIILLCLLVILCCAIILIRNMKVYKYKTKLLEQVSRAADRDIDLHRKWRWRYDYLDSVSYGKMVKMFWKPLDSFYKDKSCIEL